MKALSVLIIGLLMVLIHPLSTQASDRSNYVIVTTFFNNGYGEGGEQIFVVPVDSLKKETYSLVRLITEDALNNADDTSFSGMYPNEDYVYDLLDSLKMTCHSSEITRTIQICSKTWGEAPISYINVYVTACPVRGEFAEVVVNDNAEEESRYMVPSSEFTLFPDFWEGREHYALILADFSNFDFYSSGGMTPLGHPIIGY